MSITVADYFGKYWDHPDATPEVRANADHLLSQVNMLLEVMKADGCTLLWNPHTSNLIAGSRNGGFRPQDCPIGAPKSKHKTGRGVDIYDPYRELAKWCYAHPDGLMTLGLTMENARWTPSWLHLQDIPPGPVGSAWRLDFVPSNDPPLAAALPGQTHS